MYSVLMASKFRFWRLQTFLKRRDRRRLLFLQQKYFDIWTFRVFSKKSSSLVIQNICSTRLLSKSLGFMYCSMSYLFPRAVSIGKFSLYKDMFFLDDDMFLHRLFLELQLYSVGENIRKHIKCCRKVWKHKCECKLVNKFFCRNCLLRIYKLHI